MKSLKAKSQIDIKPIVISKVELENITYEQLIAEARQREKQKGEFTIKEFCKDSGMTESTATRFLEEKIALGLMTDRKVGSNRFYKFVKVGK